MSASCPHCQTPLNFSDEQQAKIDQARARLQPGASLKVKCPKCGGVIDMDSLTEPTPPARQEPPRLVVQPPGPPPLDWLASGEVNEGGKVEDVPMALVLFPAGQACAHIENTLKDLGYQTVCTDDDKEALERMRFTRFACIAYQAEMHGDLATSAFHCFLSAMPMEYRRHIFYILVGDGLRTLYDLEALALSVNLTVNSKDLPRLRLILRKAFQAHEELFGPLLEELGVFSKA